MGSKWRKVKESFSSNLCVYIPTSSDESPPPSQRSSGGAALLSSPATDWSLGSSLLASPRFRFSKSLSRSSKVNKGSVSPAFILKDQDGKNVSLSKFKGKPLVVYFYPADETHDCTKQVHGELNGYEE